MTGPDPTIYKRGIAVGHSNVRSDTLTFRWQDETFTFPCADVPSSVYYYNGYFYEAKVKQLRALARRLGHGR